MVKILTVTSPTSSGKDYLLKKLKEQNIIDEHVLSDTTRPMRINEQQGREYNFISEAQYFINLANDSYIESRMYNTEQGIWHYATPVNNNIDFNSNKTYVVILDYGGLCRYKKWLEENKQGQYKLYSIYLDVSVVERMKRSIDRQYEELKQDDDKCYEICRRILADKEEVAKFKNKFEHVLKNETVEDLEKNIEYIKELLED